MAPPPPNVATATVVAVPPPGPTIARPSSLSNGVSVSLPSSDPRALLDALERRRASTSSGTGTAATTNNSNDRSSNTASPPVFDAIEFLNQHYTSESMMVAQLPGLREAISERMEKLDDRISNVLQRQSETADATRRHVQDAKASVVALEHRIRLVKEKASQSERAVLEITKDMKRLDCAKRHLQRTITTLKQLHMLVHAVEQLRLTCIMEPFPDYKTASHLVDATRQLLQHFDAYTHKVEPMRLLSQKVNDLQEDLHLSLVRGFRVVAFGPAKALEMQKANSKGKDTGAKEGIEQAVDQMNPTVLQGGVMLIDSLGEDVKNQFINEFCQDQLGEYLKAFEPPSQEPKVEKRVSSFKAVEVKADPEKSPACLDQVERRFVWFRGVLQEVEKKFPKVFPPEWNLQVSMARHFLNLTRDHILTLLEGPRKDPDSANATILLKALNKTIVFETEMSAWLQHEYGVVFRDGESADKKSGTTGTSTIAPTEPLAGVASAAFENYMKPYIALEEKSMDELLVEALEDKKVDTRGERPVFISSTNLFVYIKGSITRCTALTKGRAFYQLYGAFKDSLRKYAKTLDGKLPSAVTTSNVVGGISFASSLGASKQENTKATDASYKIPKGEEVTVCRVISTCEYCADTMDALEDLIQDTIDSEYKSKVDMMGDQEEFHDITAKAIRVLVSGLMNRCDNDLKIVSSTNWATLDSVGEESAYVLSMRQEIQPFVTSIRDLLPSSYFRSFCDKFASCFSTTYYDTLVRLRRINEPATQQLLLDVYNLKTLFLKLPVLENVKSPGKKSVSAGSTIAPAIYTKMVQKQFGKIETLLKLVGTPIDLLIDNFRVQWANGSALDLQVVMSLKGLKRADQAAMLEKFGLDPATALKGATVNVTSASIISERVQALQDQSSSVATKVNSEMRLKVDDFRKSFR